MLRFERIDQKNGVKGIQNMALLDAGLVISHSHKNIDIWRDSLHGGLRVRYKNSNIILTGGVNDIWQDTKTKKLIIVDYKSQAKNGLVLIEDYLNDPYHESYKIQMDFYSYLLKKLGFEVHSTSFFLVCNANRQKKILIR